MHNRRASVLRQTMQQEIRRESQFVFPIPLTCQRGLTRGYAAGCLLAGVVSSNPAGGINVCLLWVLCVVR
jgi:hypothetical protein